MKIQSAGLFDIAAFHLPGHGFGFLAHYVFKTSVSFMIEAQSPFGLAEISVD